MRVATSEIRRQVMAELRALPFEYHSLLLQMIRTYRESVTLKPAAESLARGWQEAQAGEILPIQQLWEGVDAK